MKKKINIIQVKYTYFITSNLFMWSTVRDILSIILYGYLTYFLVIRNQVRSYKLLDMFFHWFWNLFKNYTTYTCRKFSYRRYPQTSSGLPDYHNEEYFSYVLGLPESRVSGTYTHPQTFSTVWHYTLYSYNFFGFPLPLPNRHMGLS